MKRKNILAVIALVAVFAFALVGCGSKDKEPTANTAASVPEMSVGQELTLPPHGAVPTVPPST